jgi:tripeptidyl-peptidase-1
MITSGGGFSNVSTLPTWQQTVVNAYLNSGVQLPEGMFDPTKRAFPDVSVNGHNYVIQMQTQGGYIPVDGYII